MASGCLPAGRAGLDGLRPFDATPCGRIVGWVTGSPPTPPPAHPTLLKALVVARRWRTHATFVREYARAAARVDESLARSAPGREQYERWLAGRVKTMPYPHHCGVVGQTHQEHHHPHHH